MARIRFPGHRLLHFCFGRMFRIARRGIEVVHLYPALRSTRNDGLSGGDAHASVGGAYVDERLDVIDKRYVLSHGGAYPIHVRLRGRLLQCGGTRVFTGHIIRSLFGRQGHDARGVGVARSNVGGATLLVARRIQSLARPHVKLRVGSEGSDKTVVV
jgi:hypothetical protein